MTYLKELSFPATLRPFGNVLDHFFSNVDQLQGSDDLPREFPRVNITENATGYKLELLAPGYTKEELKLSTEKDLLTIRAEHQAEELKEEERYTRREFSTRSFSRSFRLPELVDAEGITAAHSNGVLTVGIPKKAEMKPAVKQITIG